MRHPSLPCEVQLKAYSKPISSVMFSLVPPTLWKVTELTYTFHFLLLMAMTSVLGLCAL